MVEWKIQSMKERLWPAGVAALVMHGLMIAAMALGITYPQGTPSQDFCVEVMFTSPCEKKTSGLFTSPLVGEVDSDRREEAGEGYLFSRKKSQRRNLFTSSRPSPTPPLRLRSDLSHKGRGKQPVSKKPVSGGHPTGETNDAFPLFNPPPIYPYEAKRKGIQGVVLVQLSITETGSVDKAITLSPRMDSLLEEAALNAIYKWKFKPGVRTLEVPIEFKLEA